jgi:hypothetical protein
MPEIVHVGRLISSSVSQSRKSPYDHYSVGETLRRKIQPDKNKQKNTNLMHLALKVLLNPVFEFAHIKLQI